MASSSTITRLKGILLVDLVVVSLAAAGYMYIGALPMPFVEPAFLQLSDLSVNRTQAYLGQAVGVSINVTNMGKEAGAYPAILEIDGVIVQSKYMELPSGGTKTAQFVVSGVALGTHTLSVGSSQGKLKVIAAIAFSDLAVNRSLAGVGEPVGISVRVTSEIEDSIECPLTLIVNGTSEDNRTIELAAGASETVGFGIVERDEGTYAFEVGGLTGTFRVMAGAPPPKPAEFVLSGLSISPGQADLGVPVNVTVTVANAGEFGGNCSVTLSINGQAMETKNLTLLGGALATLKFSVLESAVGSFSVKVGNLTGTFSVRKPSSIVLYFFLVEPYEVHPGDTVNVSIEAENRGNETSSLPVQLQVDDQVVQVTTVQLAPGAKQAVNFSLVAGQLAGTADMEKHMVAIEGHVDSFLLVRSGYHTLSVGSMSGHTIEITIKGRTYVTPAYYQALPEGIYVISVPASDPTGKYAFLSWNDGDTNTTKTILLKARTALTAVYAGGSDSSCPSLYSWNGTEYSYVSDISNHGWLGYINYFNEDGTIVFYRNNPWDYVPLDSLQMEPVNGVFNLRVVQSMDEIFYLDQAYMMVVDHPANVNVYSTMEEQYLDPNYMGNIYTIGANPLTPVSAVNEKGVDVLPLISKTDGVFTPGINGLNSPSWDNITWNRLTLNLGDLSNATQIRLVIRAVVDWGSPDDYATWLNKFFEQTVPNGTQVTPPPYMEVKDAKGDWARIPDSRQIPLPPDGVARTFVVDLTGLFPTNDYSLRISNFWNVTFDYIGIDTSPQVPIAVQRINPTAYLYQTSSTNSISSGNFTRYGDVTQLVTSEDDMFVIGRQGDAVALQFDASALRKPSDGMVRDYFFFVSCWFKDQNGNWGFGFGFIVDPLPFHDMSGFPYPATEGYPYDAAHLAYLSEYNTRVVAPP